MGTSILACRASQGCFMHYQDINFYLARAATELQVVHARHVQAIKGPRPGRFMQAWVVSRSPESLNSSTLHHSIEFCI